MFIGIGGIGCHSSSDIGIGHQSFLNGASGYPDEERFWVFVGQTDNGRSNGQGAEGVALLLSQVHGPGHDLHVGAELLAESNRGVAVGEGHLTQKRGRLIDEDVAESVLPNHSDGGLENRFLASGHLGKQEIVSLLDYADARKFIPRALVEPVAIEVQHERFGEHHSVR